MPENRDVPPMEEIQNPVVDPTPSDSQFVDAVTEQNILSQYCDYLRPACGFAEGEPALPRFRHKAAACVEAISLCLPWLIPMVTAGRFDGPPSGAPKALGWGGIQVLAKLGPRAKPRAVVRYGGRPRPAPPGRDRLLAVNSR